MWVTAALGPVLMGWVADHMGHYGLAFLGGTLVNASPSCSACWPVPRSAREREGRQCRVPTPARHTARASGVSRPAPECAEIERSATPLRWLRRHDAWATIPAAVVAERRR